MPARIRLGRLLLGWLLVALIGACAGPSQATPGLPSSGVPSASVRSTAAPESPSGGAGASPSVGAGSSQSPEPGSSPSLAPPASISGPAYDNPVFRSDFPDPHIIVADGKYYAYSTNSAGQNVPIISSDDLATWQRERDALPILPSWTGLNFGTRWAPGVIQIDDTFVLYYVACDANFKSPGYTGQVCVLPVDRVDRQCIGIAIADNPLGPFTDESDEPFICQYEMGGSIDAYPFRDADGQLYLYWKSDGNCCGLPVSLWVQRLADDGMTLTGEPVELIARDQVWEIPLIENPAMVEWNGSYYLFYSANRWDTIEYAVGYAVCESALGPCEKPQDGPIYRYTQQVFGPGGQAFFNDADGDLMMVYHAWQAPLVGYPRGQRMMQIDPVTFEDGVPVITGPTTDPQPLT